VHMDVGSEASLAESLLVGVVVFVPDRRIGLVKGTVARDFLVSVFFIDLLYIGPRFRG
jgi:hypothetical protein